MKLGSLVIGIVVFAYLLANLDSISAHLNGLSLAADASTQLDFVIEKDSSKKEIIRPTFMEQEQLKNEELPAKRIGYLLLSGM